MTVMAHQPLQLKKIHKKWNKANGLNRIRTGDGWPAEMICPDETTPRVFVNEAEVLGELRGPRNFPHSDWVISPQLHHLHAR